ncbi:carboxypeptidase inhibitor SmCI-like [Erythrolamprus reginae]|uniref:carboxypeptidase inhibitor SmCI-like n=1 Tax=Erythrolamprus reginae TaxID=121349 RepID=UPI00396C7642
MAEGRWDPAPGSLRLTLRGNPAPGDSGRCYIPKDGGYCKRKLRRYYFNSAKKNCEIFTYGGCGGNPNRFEHYNQCMGTCYHIDLAYLWGGRGPEYSGAAGDRQIWRSHGAGRPRGRRDHCLKAIPISGLMSSAGGTGDKCNPGLGLKQLLLNARSIDACSAGEMPEICNLPAKVGLCKAAFHRFSFNVATGNCEEFIYGGCKGNENNFVTLSECRSTCQNSAQAAEVAALRVECPVILRRSPSSATRSVSTTVDPGELDERWAPQPVKLASVVIVTKS